VPTAVAGWIPNSRIRSGVMSEPPPTPVMPTRRPTPNPDSEYSGSITSIERLLSRVRGNRAVTKIMSYANVALIAACRNGSE
jgi:hypothetical protein